MIKPNLPRQEIQTFNDTVGIRFQLFNSLFTSLPFHKIEKTGILLTLLLIECEEGFSNGQSPVDIIEHFFSTNLPSYDEQEQTELLFRFIQYAERQVVLFDSLEDAAYPELHPENGSGSVQDLYSQVLQADKVMELKEKLEDYSVRMVLTAHPTQFYPGAVLGIINDLSAALRDNDSALINIYLQQLGKTPFLNREKPTPYDEARSLIWYLQHTFYNACGKIALDFQHRFGTEICNTSSPLIRMGFWPGGDRDGNPFVKTETTLQVAQELHRAIIHCYHKDMKRLLRRLTFRGVEEIIKELENSLFNCLYQQQEPKITAAYLKGRLEDARYILTEYHNGLFVALIDEMLAKIAIFGLYFATLDIRQDSSVHADMILQIAAKTDLLPADYPELTETEKIAALLSVNGTLEPSIFENEVQRDTFNVMHTIRTIQEDNGEYGCDRYIISHCTSALNVVEVFVLLQLAGWPSEAVKTDIMPLFESIDDLAHASRIMKQLYQNEAYARHLESREGTQSIMLGFSDGTKDGGYFMANWAIYKAKEELTSVSRQHSVKVLFFDGRGGPPARGGGKTQRFYASMGNNIESREIQLTIQGQTISANFGTEASAHFNTEQLVTAGLFSNVLRNKTETLTAQQESLMSQLARISYRKYMDLRNHPQFMNYLVAATPLRYFGDTNIGSRPSKRNSDAGITLDSLRAIPFVGSWSQSKQNVTGYYGLGSAIKEMKEAGKLDALKELYSQSLFFRTLIDNSEMSMVKSYFPLTAYLKEQPEWASIWLMLYEEYTLTEEMVLSLNGHTELMQEYPVEKKSIQMRDRIVLPIATIQQYALNRLRSLPQGYEAAQATFGKMVTRCAFGLINAGRNSA